jgi:hypothetical protein
MLMCVGVYEPAINAVAKYFGVADLLLVLSMYGDTFRHRLRPATMKTILCTFSSDPWSQSCTNARLKQCTRRIERGTDSRWMTEHWHTDQTVRIDLILHSCTWWSNSIKRIRVINNYGTDREEIKEIDAEGKYQSLVLAPQLKSCHYHFIPRNSFCPRTPYLLDSEVREEVIDLEFHPNLLIVALVVASFDKSTKTTSNKLLVYTFGELGRQWNSRKMLEVSFEQFTALYKDQRVLIKWSPKGSYLLTRESGFAETSRLGRLSFYKLDRCLGRLYKIVGSAIMFESHTLTKNIWLSDNEIILPNPAGTTGLPRMVTLAEDGLSTSISEPWRPDSNEAYQYPIFQLTALTGTLVSFATNCLLNEGPRGRLCPHEHQRLHIRCLNTLTSLWLIDIPGFVLSMQAKGAKLCVLFVRPSKWSRRGGPKICKPNSKPGKSRPNEPALPPDLADFLEAMHARSFYNPFLWTPSHIKRHRTFLDELNRISSLNSSACQLASCAVQEDEMVFVQRSENSFEYFEFDLRQGDISFYRLLHDNLAPNINLLTSAEYDSLWNLDPFARSNYLSHKLASMRFMDVSTLLTTFYTTDRKLEWTVNTKALHRKHKSRGLYSFGGSGKVYFSRNNVFYLDCRSRCVRLYGFEIRCFELGSLLKSRCQHLFDKTSSVLKIGAENRCEEMLPPFVSPGRRPSAGGSGEDLNFDFYNNSDNSSDDDDDDDDNDNNEGAKKVTENKGGNKTSSKACDKELWNGEKVDASYERDIFDECDTVHELNQKAFAFAYKEDCNYIVTRKRSFRPKY